MKPLFRTGMMAWLLIALGSGCATSSGDHGTDALPPGAPRGYVDFVLRGRTEEPVTIAQYRQGDARDIGKIGGSSGELLRVAAKPGVAEFVVRPKKATKPKLVQVTVIAGQTATVHVIMERMRRKGSNSETVGYVWRVQMGPTTPAH